MVHVCYMIVLNKQMVNNLYFILLNLVKPWIIGNQPNCPNPTIQKNIDLASYNHWYFLSKYIYKITCIKFKLFYVLKHTTFSAQTQEDYGLKPNFLSS